MLPQNIKKFIEKNIELIDELKFDMLYDRALKGNSGIHSEVGRLTDALLRAGINPLNYLDAIPSLYLDGSELKHLVVPENIKFASKGSLSFSKLENVEFPDNCELSDLACHNSELRTVRIPNIMNEIPMSCFYNCTELVSVDLNAVEQIEEEAFAYCEKLSGVFISDDITFISSEAFRGCSNLVFLVHSDNVYAQEYAKKHHIEVHIV